jgi:hypothetical protein
MLRRIHRPRPNGPRDLPKIVGRCGATSNDEAANHGPDGAIKRLRPTFAAVTLRFKSHAPAVTPIQ